MRLQHRSAPSAEPEEARATKVFTLTVTRPDKATLERCAATLKDTIRTSKAVGDVENAARALSSMPEDVALPIMRELALMQGPRRSIVEDQIKRLNSPAARSVLEEINEAVKRRQIRR
jgi:hypothetical protein